tara:strand:- start:2383 stop:3102 length:720 start_codon:yes stop_codon:yes gene_type:complete
MKLDYMTVTGADDETNIHGMFELSKDFPFLEWGILFPSVGSFRFPSSKWLEKLKTERQDKKVRLNLSAHLCGEDLTDALNNKLKISLGGFQRVQLNFHGLDYTELLMQATVQQFLETQEEHKRNVIFQFDGVNDNFITKRFDINKFPHIEYLFDTSSGAGILPTTFPMPYSGVTCGFAGGLGPESINETLLTFKEVLSPNKHFWIDMETKVRTDGVFDLNKVAQCASSVSEIVYGRLSI